MKHNSNIKKFTLTFIGLLLAVNIFAATHKILVWSGYYSFINEAAGTNILLAPLTVQLGDTIHFLPYDPPTMMHTITSTNIPSGAQSFNQMWQLPADTFFQYIPTVVGVYNFECTPHVSMNMIGSFTVGSSVGVTELNSNFKFEAYPNPASDKINIKVNKDLINKSFVLYDETGKVILTNHVNDLITIIDTDKIFPGIYFIMFDDKRHQVLKIVIE
ncbi:MAG: T9SS type A sorting domain-containing protein [Bacteroidota bacterium]